MLRLRRLFVCWTVLVGLLVAWPGSVRAQDVTVSDATAYREFFLMASRPTAASKSHLRSVGLSPTDSPKFEADIKKFRSTFDKIVEDYNAKARADQATPDEFWQLVDSLTYSTMTELSLDLSVPASKRLGAFVQNFKRNVGIKSVTASIHNHGSMLMPAAFHPGPDPQGCQVSGSYNMTWSYSIANGTLYVSTITSGTGHMSPYCPHGNYLHTATATNTINGHSGSAQYADCPACYLSAEFDNSQTVSGLPIDDFPFGTQGDIKCTLAATFWELSSLLHMQIEGANTTSQVEWDTKGTNAFGHNFWNSHAVCPALNPPDSPPDFPGPDWVLDTDPISSGFVRTGDICARWAYWGVSFTGAPWWCMNVPRTDAVTKYPIMESVSGSGQQCTLRDNGYEPAF